jgi:hypothetical protein
MIYCVSKFEVARPSFDYAIEYYLKTLDKGIRREVNDSIRVEWVSMCRIDVIAPVQVTMSLIGILAALGEDGLISVERYR